MVIMLMLAKNPDVSAIGIMASDFGWQKVGQDSFLITLTLYNDCNSSSPGNARINFRCATSGVLFDSLIITAPNGTEVTPVCSSTQTRCQNSSSTFPYGITRYVYSGIKRLTLAGSCCNINMSYQVCCRNISITTVSSNSNFYTEAEFNRCTTLTDNAPTFSNSPVKILCLGEDFTYNSGTIDLDTNSTGGTADSLTYYWACPLQSAGSVIPYSGQYWCDRPIYFWGFPSYQLPFPRGFHLDPSTGDLQFRPMKVEVAPMTIEIDEFRNGVQIAIIRHEMEMMVINCSGNNPPSITTPNNVRSKSVCTASSVSFTFTTNDQNYNDSVTLSWNQSIPGATWSTTNGQTKHPTATLTWTPTQSQTSSLPYTFAVTAKDNACPINAQFTQAYQITVKPLPVANYSVTDTGCGQYYFEAIPIKGSHITYQWTGSGGINYTASKFIHQYKSPGTYPFRFSYSSGGCGSGYNDTIRTDTFLWIKLPKDTTICKGTSVTLTAQSFNAIGNLQYQWSAVQGDTLPTRTFRIYTDTNVILWITDKSGCTAKDTMHVKIYLPKVDAGKDTAICLNDMAILRAKGGVKFKWSNGDTTATTRVNPITTQYFYVTVTDTNNCPNRDSVFVRVNALPYADAGPDRAICLNQQVTLVVIGGKTYKWNTGETKNSITKTPMVSTNYFVKVTDSNNCSKTDTVLVTVNLLPKVNAGPDLDICSLKGYHYLSGKPDSNSGNGYWTGTAVYRSPSGSWYFNPNANGIKHLGKYPVYYYFTDTNGCSGSDTAVLTVYTISPVDAGQYNKQCIDGSPIMLNGNPPGGYWTVDSVFAPFFNPVWAGIGKHQVIYHLLNSVCPNSDTTYIEVIPLPVIETSTLSGRTELCPQGLVQLTASPVGGRFGGKWSGDVVPYNYFNTNRTEGIYSVIYSFKDDYGCSNADTLFLRLSYPKVIIDTSLRKVCYGKMISLKARYNMADNILWSKDISSDGIINGSTADTEVYYIPGENDFKNGGFWIRVNTISSVCKTVTDSIYIRTGYHPKTNFSSDVMTGKFPLNVNFTDLSTIQNGSITGFNWEFGDGNYSIIQNPVNTYLNSGSYDVKLTTVSEMGCLDSITKHNYIYASTSLPEDINAVYLKVFPNPAKGFIEVSISDKSNKIAHLYFYDASGRLTDHQNIGGQNSTRIDTHNLTSGLYQIRVVSDNGMEYRAKFVKE